MKTPALLVFHRIRSRLDARPCQPTRLFGRNARCNRLRLEWLEERTLLATFTVTNVVDSGPGSLRQAILDSNAATGQTNTIDFAIPDSGVQTIAPLSALPAISQAVLIDGWSQPGYAGTPLVQIDGGQAGDVDGLLITGSNVTVRGLDISDFSQGAGIHITGTGATGDWVYGNFLGTDPTGTEVLPNLEGVKIDAGAADNLVGTDGDGVNDAAEQNLISGNLFAGVWIDGQGTSNSVVAGNFIGTDATGSVAFDFENGTQPVTDSQGNVIGGGVVISAGASDNRIGTSGRGIDDVGERNVIGGSGNDGIDIYGMATDGNLVAGNFVGTDVTGTSLGDLFGDGIFLAEGASSNWIGVNPLGGGTVADEGNVIVGAWSFDVQLSGGANGNVLAGNTIGAGGLSGSGGVQVDGGSASNRIGGAAPGDGNVISAYGSYGIRITGTGSADNLVQGNTITKAKRSQANSQNGTAGVQIDGGAANNTIGGNTLAEGNLITEDYGPGVAVLGASSVGNQITANRIYGNTGPAIDLGHDGPTSNSIAPRKGPNNFQNAPILTAADGGQVQGLLAGSAAQETFRIDVYASAGQGPGGAGEAEDYLGSIQVRTDAEGQARFVVPFAAPPGLPIITATATDPRGNTSEVSGFRQGTLDVPGSLIRITPGQPFVFSAQSGAPITLLDPTAGPLDLVWDLTLSVSSGTLTLSQTAGLTGAGDGTGSLIYDGPLSAIDAGLAGLTYTPPAGFLGAAVLSLTASSAGAPPLQSSLTFSPDHMVFTVTSVADHGPGSLRQALLDSNTVVASSDTIDFSIPGPGPHTIELQSALPAVATTLQIDGTSQPGYAGTPLIVLDTSAAGGPDGLAISGAGLTLSGVSVPELALGLGQGHQTSSVTIQSAPVAPGPGGDVVMARIDTIVAGMFLAHVPAQAQGFVARLALLDTNGSELVESDGLAPGKTEPSIDEYLPAGTYTLLIGLTAGATDYGLTASLAPAVAPLQNIPASTAVVAGDFNGDGHTDLALLTGRGYSNNGRVSALMGNGDGTFQPPVAYFVGTNPAALVAGDFNGDGRTDLAVVNDNNPLGNNGTLVGNGTVSVLIGNGDGTFQPQVTYSVGGGACAIVAGDFRGDGRVDLAVANKDDNTVSVLLGNGDGTFQYQDTYAVGSGPDGIAEGDFTGNGHIDLAVTNAYGSGGMSVLLGNGDGTFQSAVTHPLAAGAAIVAGDFNGDGRIDVAVAAVGVEVGVEVLLGNGDGTFQPPVIYSGLFPSALVMGDFNGDGRIDLAVASSSGGDHVTVLLGNGDGTFQSFQPQPVGGGNEMVAADFNGDGLSDLACSDGNVLLGKGDGTFESRLQNSTVYSPAGIVSGDFNGDGRTDVATVDPSGTVSVLLGNGDGTFQPSVTFAAGPNPAALVAGDFNGDGRTDLVVASLGSVDSNGNYIPGSFTVEVLLGNGDGTFLPPASYPDGLIPSAIAAGDFNGDGRIDLAVAGSDPTTYDGEVSVLLGNGDGTFQPPVTYTVGDSGDAIAAGDFNGDGRTDLAALVTDNFPQRDSVSVLLGNGDGTFRPAVPYSAGAPNTFYSAIVAGDFNGDGRTDLALDRIGVPSVSVLTGNGDGTFQAPIAYSLAVAADVSGVESIVAGDFNGDGRTDLAVAGEDTAGGGEVSVLMANGDGAFQPPVSFATGLEVPPYDIESIVAGDFNGDGRTDLAVADRFASSVSVLIGNGDGTFSSSAEVVTSARSSPVVTNVNGDATPDVLVLDSAGNILYRRGVPGQPGTFEPPVTINPGAPSQDIAWVPDTNVGAVLASVDSRDDAVSIYAYRDNAFEKVGSLPTGRLPAQVIAADLNGNGLTDLIIRNATDGTLSIDFAVPRSVAEYPGLGPTFLPTETISVGLGVSDIQAIDTTGDGLLDLVVTNQVSGQVGILHNLGGGYFGPLEPYRAGTALSAIDSSASPEVTSLEATSALAGAPLSPGGPTDLVVTNPGSNTLGLLDGLGGGLFANPVAMDMQTPAQMVSLADLTGNGIPDLVLLGSAGVTVMLGDGKGGFGPAVAFDAGPEPTGLTIADLSGDGIPDLLISNPYGDLLILQGNGDGTFRPYRQADQAVALAVADLTGSGEPDFIYADQALDRVVVQYGTSQTTVLGDHSSGLLSPGAVKLADLNGDGIPDLIVANSGSNNVLVYPGLGNGQFGPATNGGHGYFVGTNPTGIAVANLNGQPDLIVANAGSNDVSILLGQGSGSSWTLIPGPRIKTDGGPVAVAVGNILGDGKQDLAVANQQADNVQVFPGLGGGFFGQNATTYAVGQAPDGLFLGDFTGSGTQLAALNGGSNTISVIDPKSGGVTQTVSTDGVFPSAGFAGDFSGNGYTDLVVGNSGSGQIALFTGGAEGLSLDQSILSPEAPLPTSLSFAGVAGGVLSFYAASSGREAAALLAFNLNEQQGETGTVSGQTLGGTTGQSTGQTLAAATAGLFQQVSQLLGSGSSVFDLIAPLFTVSVIPGTDSSVELSGEGGVALLASFTSAATPGVSVGQSLRLDGQSAPQETGETRKAAEKPADPEVHDEGLTLPLWARIAIGLEQSFDQVRAELLKNAGVRDLADDRSPPARPELRQKADTAPATPPPGATARPTKTSFHAVIDAAIAELAALSRDWWEPSPQEHEAGDLRTVTVLAPPRHIPPIVAAALASAAVLAGKRQVDRNRRVLNRRVGENHRYSHQ